MNTKVHCIFFVCFLIIAGCYIVSCGSPDENQTSHIQEELNVKSDVNREKMDAAMRLELRNQRSMDSENKINFLLLMNAAPDSITLEKLLETGVNIFTKSGPILTGKGYPTAILKLTLLDAVVRIEKSSPPNNP